MQTLPHPRRRGRAALSSVAVAAFLALAAPSVAAFGAPRAAAPAPAAQDDPKPDKREEVKVLVAKFKAHIKERGKEDLEAVGAIDSLLKEFAASGPKDRELIAKTFGEALKERRKPSAEGVADNKLYLAAAVGLGECAPESVPVLTGWIDHKDHRDDLELQRALILSLGKSKEKAAVKTLTKLLVHHRAAIQAATSEALVNFKELPLADRKEIFKAVLDQLTQIRGQIDTDPNDVIEKERYDTVRAPMRAVLEAMSKQSLGEPAEWRSWWNNNKTKDWDKLG